MKRFKNKGCAVVFSSIGQTPGQNTSRQLATSSENLVASAQFLVALATSESQFRTLTVATHLPYSE